MPRLVDAARDAQTGVRLENEPIVHEAAKVLDQLAVILFAHGVYRCAAFPSQSHHHISRVLYPYPRQPTSNTLPRTTYFCNS